MVQSIESELVSSTHFIQGNELWKLFFEINIFYVEHCRFMVLSIRSFARSLCFKFVVNIFIIFTKNIESSFILFYKSFSCFWRSSRVIIVERRSLILIFEKKSKDKRGEFMFLTNRRLKNVGVLKLDLNKYILT